MVRQYASGPGGRPMPLVRLAAMVAVDSRGGGLWTLPPARNSGIGEAMARSQNKLTLVQDNKKPLPWWWPHGRRKKPKPAPEPPEPWPPAAYRWDPEHPEAPTPGGR